MEAEEFKVNNLIDIRISLSAQSDFFRFVSLLYNAEAVEVANHSPINQGVASENASLFFQPVAYDAEASFHRLFVSHV